MLSSWMDVTGSKLGLIFLRVLLVTMVSIYAIFGAIILSHLETQEVDQWSNFISQNDAIQIFTQSTLFPPVYANRWNRSQNNIRQCITDIIRDLLKKSDCSNIVFDHLSLRYFKRCYYYNLFSFSNMTDNEKRNNSNNHLPTYIQPSNLHDSEMINDLSAEGWPFIDSLLFVFSLITTIGYGNITPKTFAGQIFCIFFSAFGVPLTLLTIADLGKFISEIIFACNDRFSVQLKRFWRRNSLRKRFKTIISNHRSNKFINNNFNDKLLHDENDNNESNGQNNSDNQVNETDGSTETSDNNEQSNRTLVLFVLFIIYVITGSLLLSSYEPEMPFFTAIYFSFITLTSIGLGDIVPQRRAYMVITIVYIIVGLALTTIAIEIASDTLTKLHYFRRQIKNVGNIQIWFGGKRLTVRQIIRNLCDQFNVPDSALSGFNIGHFVEQAIKVEAREIPSLRKTRRQEIYDGDENESFTKVSITISEGESEFPSENEPEPPPIPVEEVEPESPPISVEEVEPESSPIPVEEMEPESPPISMEEVEPEPTPEYESEHEPEEEIPPCEPTSLPEPTPITVELELIPDPELCLLKLSQEMERIPYIPEIPELTAQEPLEVLERTKKPKQNTSTQRGGKTAKESPVDPEILRRKGYSEEAWKRYQQYRSEWNKFRRLSHTLSRKEQQKGAKSAKKGPVTKRPDASH